MILGGVQCVFKREIPPYKPYEIWSRVLSWDDKWLYMVSHFVEMGAFKPNGYYLQDNRDPQPTNTNTPPSREVSEEQFREKMQKKVFASAVSRYVFKQGRKTLPPEKMLQKCGLLPAGFCVSEQTNLSFIDESAVGSLKNRNIAGSNGPNIKSTVYQGEEAKEAKEAWDSIEERRRQGLEAAQLKLGWDAVHELFDGDTWALGRYMDLLWR